MICERRVTHQSPHESFEEGVGRGLDDGNVEHAHADRTRRSRHSLQRERALWILRLIVEYGITPIVNIEGRPSSSGRSSPPAR